MQEDVLETLSIVQDEYDFHENKDDDNKDHSDFHENDSTDDNKDHSDDDKDHSDDHENDSTDDDKDHSDDHENDSTDDNIFLSLQSSDTKVKYILILFQFRLYNNIFKLNIFLFLFR